MLLLPGVTVGGIWCDVYSAGCGTQRGSGAEQGAQVGTLGLPGSCRASVSQWEPLGEDPGNPKRCGRVVKIHLTFGKGPRNAAHEANTHTHKCKYRKHAGISTHIIHIKKCLVNGYILLGSSQPLSTILSPPKDGTLNKHFKHKKLLKP